MTFDTLEYNGTEKDFASWGFGLNSIVGKKRANAMDTFTATMVNSTIAAETDTPTFPFEARIIVRSNRAGAGGIGPYTGGTVKFVGKRIKQPVKATSAGQGVTYEFQGPWYDLSSCDFMQLFQGNGATYYLPETILFTANQVLSLDNGSVVYWLPISVGDQIQAILQFLLDQYAAQGMTAPFQYVGRTLNGGAIDLTHNAGRGTPGGNYNFWGMQFNYPLPGGMSIDQSLFSLFLPSFIEKPIKCAQALQKCLQLSPRVNIWFDYSATSAGQPLPMIRFDLVDSMSAVSLPLFTGAKYDGTMSHKSIQMTPRYDLMIRAAIVKYRISESLSGSTVVNYAVDKWSPGGSNVNLDGAGNNATDPNAGLRVLNEMVDLQGYTNSVVTGHMDVEPLACYGGSGAQTAKRAWWASKRGGEVSKLEDNRVRFQDAAGAQTTIPNAKFYYSSNGVDSNGQYVSAGQEFTAADYATFGYRIVRGTYQSWMKQTAGVLAVKAKAVAKMVFAEYNVNGTGDTDTTTGDKQKHLVSGDHHVNLELTNAQPDSGASGYATFSVLASSTPGESYIIGAGGIAQYLYQHLNTLQFDGDAVFVSANFVDSSSSQFVTLGKKLNLTGGASAWTGMNAQIQEITEDYGTHTTSVQIGVARMLSAGDLSSLFAMWRFRRTWYNPAMRSNNTIVGGGAVDMARASAGANTTGGLEVESYRAVMAPDPIDGGRTNIIQHDATTGQPQIVQKPTAGGTAYISAPIPPMYAGSGAPAAGLA